MGNGIMTLENVSKAYIRSSGTNNVKNQAVLKTNLSIAAGEIVALVGESGCGKTTVARLMAHLVHPSSGTIHYGAVDIFNLSRKQLRDFRREVRLIFQSPDASLNPGMSVRMILSEVAGIHSNMTLPESETRAIALLTALGLSGEFLDRYPHQLSTGQKKRIGIARALMVPPKLLIADEPLSGIDASHSQQILDFLLQEHQASNMSMFLISHDINLVCRVAHRILVMNNGRIVEEIFSDSGRNFVPIHTYSKLLFDAQNYMNNAENGTMTKSGR